MRTNFDFSPYRRSTVGFDRVFDLLETGLRSESSEGFPPFDIEKVSDDRYDITLAIAGFRRDEIDIIAQDNLLVVTGRKDETTGEERYLHRGIATRSFERRFQLADFIQVDGARFENGLLTLALRREIPETKKPRRIEIGATADNDRLDRPPADDRQAA